MLPVLSLLVFFSSASLMAQTESPFARSIGRVAARAAAAVPAPVVAGGDSRPDSASQSDWSRVMHLEDTDIVLSTRGSPRSTLQGSPSGRRTVVRGATSETTVTVLNLTDPLIPAAARKALADAAFGHPECFTAQRPGCAVRLNKHVHMENGTVFVDDRRVIDVESVIERIDRTDVAEISRVHRATKKAAGWGALLGGGIAVAEVFARCGTDWNTETDSCGNLTGVVLFAYPVLGAVIGAVVGAANETTTAVYRAP